MVVRRPLRSWEYCSGYENFSLLSNYSKYKSLIRSCMGYCSHICGGGGSRSSSLLDRFKSKAKRLINCSLLSNSLDPLSLRRDVGALSLFYRYYNGRGGGGGGGGMAAPLLFARRLSRWLSCHP